LRDVKALKKLIFPVFQKLLNFFFQLRFLLQRFRRFHKFWRWKPHVYRCRFMGVEDVCLPW